MLRGFPIRFALAAFNRHSNISRALAGSELPHDERRIYYRAGIGYACVTSQGGVTLTGDPRELALRNAVYSVLPPESKATWSSPSTARR